MRGLMKTRYMVGRYFCFDFLLDATMHVTKIGICYLWFYQTSKLWSIIFGPRSSSKPWHSTYLSLLALLPFWICWLNWLSSKRLDIAPQRRLWAKEIESAVDWVRNNKPMDDFPWWWRCSIGAQLSSVPVSLRNGYSIINYLVSSMVNHGSSIAVY